MGYLQETVTISGKIIGLGNSKIYLGNKPNGISKGFHYIKYDSVNSKNDVFEFKNVKFNEIAFYSIQVEGSQAWLSFLIDKGHIRICAKKDSIYLGKISGSSENDLYSYYRKNLSYSFYQATQKNFDSIDKYRQIDTSKFNLYNKLNEKFETIFLSKQKEFIREYHNNFVSLIILKDIEKQISEDSLQFYFNLLSFELQNNSKATELKYRTGNFSKNMLVGNTVPDFPFKEINGKEDKLYNISGHYKLIVFWASWCGPCLAELPDLKKFYAKNQNVAIISFSIDYDKTSWIKSSKENHIPWYSFSDSMGPEGEFAAYFNVQQIPLMVLLDSDNKIIKYDVKANELKNYIQPEKY